MMLGLLLGQAEGVGGGGGGGSRLHAQICIDMCSAALHVRVNSHRIRTAC